MIAHEKSNAPKISASKQYRPEITSPDQSKEQTGKFEKLCPPNCSQIHYKRSETKSAIVERYIRTIETNVCKVRHRNETNQKMIATKKMLPAAVSQEDVPEFVSLILPQSINTTSSIRSIININTKKESKTSTTIIIVTAWPGVIVYVEFDFKRVPGKKYQKETIGLQNPSADTLDDIKLAG